MKRVFSALAIAIGCATTMSAQSQTSEVKSKTTIKVKEGKAVTVTGCLGRTADSAGYVLTYPIDRPATLNGYRLVSSDDDELEKHIGHRVEVTGKLADRDGGKVEAETKTETKVNGGETKKQEAKAEVDGSLGGLPFLGVKSVKMLSRTCR